MKRNFRREKSLHFPFRRQRQGTAATIRLWQWRLVNPMQFLRSIQLRQFPVGLGVCVVALSLAAPHAAKADDFSQSYANAAQTYNARDFSHARLQWEKTVALAQTPFQVAVAKMGLAWTLNSLSEWDASRKQWQDALALPSSPQLRVNMQIGLFQSLIGLKKADEARQIVRELQKAPEALLPKAKMQQILRQLDSVQTRERAASVPSVLRMTADGKIEMAPGATVPQVLFGWLIGDVTGKTPEEVRQILQKVADDTTVPDYKRSAATVYLGDFSFRENDLDKARELYLKAAQLDDSSPMVAGTYIKIGDTYAAQKNWAEALKFYNRSLEVVSKSDTGTETDARTKRDSVLRLLR